MPQRFIVVGPIDGYYHIAYAIPCTTLYSSIMELSSMEAALEITKDMNGEQDSHDQEKS